MHIHIYLRVCTWLQSADSETQALIASSNSLILEADMYLSIYIYLSICLYIYIYIYIYISASKHICTFISIYVSVPGSNRPIPKRRR